MNRLTIGLFLIYILSGSLPGTGQVHVNNDCVGCSVIEQALHDLQGIKVGMTRQNVEQHNFIMAGGMTVRDQTDYVYKQCEYIKLEVDFSFDPKVQRDFSPKDVITKVSKLSIDYPVKD